MKRSVILSLCALFLLCIMETPGREHAIAHVRMPTPPSVTTIPTNVDFGDQVLGHSSKARRITITNAGASDLYINSVSLTGDNQQEFAMTADACTGRKIGANKSCVIDVAFSPAKTGPRNASLKLIDNALDSPQSVRLTGNGINSVDVPPASAS